MNEPKLLFHWWSLFCCAYKLVCSTSNFHTSTVKNNEKKSRHDRTWKEHGTCRCRCRWQKDFRGNALISSFPGGRPRGHPRGIEISYNQNFVKTRGWRAREGLQRPHLRAFVNTWFSKNCLWLNNKIHLKFLNFLYFVEQLKHIYSLILLAFLYDILTHGPWYQTLQFCDFPSHLIINLDR